MKKAPKILSIKSDKAELITVENFLAEIFEENKLPKKNFNKVLVCVCEAVLNSIEHGNRNDSRKKVIIALDYFNQTIDIKIQDEGDGFDYAAIEDPTLKKNIKKEAGRGIHIIKSLCNEIEFKNRGKCVRFKLNVSE